MSRTDQELLELFRQKGREEQVFREIIEKYQERLYWLIRRYVLIHDDADDVLQNTFIKIWRGLPGFRADSGLYTWLYRIAVNEAISFIKRNANVFSVSEGMEENSLLNNLKADPYYDGDEIHAKLLMAVEKLPTKQKQVFKLKYFEDMKYDDMAEVLDTSVGSLKASYHHAIKKIQEMILKED